MRLRGAVRISERSRTPISDICRVRGIGVAESVSTSTVARICFRRSLCITPKRCSSSTTIRPRSRKTTSFCNSRWVPTTMSTLPSASAASVACCSFFVLKRESSSTRTGYDAKRAVNVRWWLRGEQRGRHEDRDLFFIGDRLECRAHRNFRLAVADVAAHEPVHRTRAFHIGFGFVDGFGLIGRRIVGKRFLEFGLPRRVRRERVTGRTLALGVQLDESVGDFRERFGDTAFRARPIGAAILLSLGAAPSCAPYFVT